MVYPELKFFPPVIAVHNDSSKKYPVEVGLLANGCAYQWYVKPDEAWLDDGFVLSKSPYYSLDYLEEVGCSNVQIAEQLEQYLVGYNIVHSLNYKRTIDLLMQLEIDKLASNTLGITDIRNLVPQDYQPNFSKEVLLNPECRALNLNHASDFCAAIAMTTIRLNDIARN